MPLSRETLFDLSAFFDKTPGADRTLIPRSHMRECFDAIGRESSRIVIQSIGESSLGNEMDLLIISSEDTIENLEAVRSSRLALSNRDLLVNPLYNSGELAGTKPVVLITAGIHATEIGGVQLMPELVRHLALSNDAEITSLLERIIILIVPTLNPDGMDLVHDWYEKTLGTHAEGSTPPELYHPYAGHDNNRDWYTHALQETRNTTNEVHRPWRPHIVLDLHQMGEHAPRYVVPPYLDPVEPHVHPRINVLTSEVGSSVASALLRAERRGASSGVLFDCFSPTRAYPHYHGGVRILAEAASAKVATPVKVSADQVKARRGFDPNLPSVHNPVPWLGGTWRLRDIIDYHLTTIYAVLDHAALHAEQWIRDQWTMLADEAGNHRPVTYVIAPLRQQFDPPATHALIETLQRGDIEIDIVEKKHDLVQQSSLIVQTNQPFGSYARALLDLTPYPMPRPDENGVPPAVPYDVTSHCLPMHLGVDVRRLTCTVPPITRKLKESDLVAFESPTASRIDRSRWLAIDARSHLAILPVINALANGAEVRRLMRPHIDNGRLLPAGTWLITDDHTFAAMSNAHQHGLRTWLVRPIPASTTAQALPRIALHMPWSGNAIDAGWARLALEQMEYPFDILHDEDIRSGRLKDYDVVLVPHLKEKELLEGNSISEYPFEYTGGLRDEGVARLYDFIHEGGHIVAIGGSANALASKLSLPIHLPLRDLAWSTFSCPGSVLRVIPDPTHPITLGMDESRPVMFADSTSFVIQPGKEGASPARYAEDNLLLSGWMQGEAHLHGTSAIIDIPVGAGMFTGFGFRPHFRVQMLTSYPMLTNALMRSGLTIDPVDEGKS